MSRTSSANLSDLRRWSDQARKRAAVEAVRAGQAVIEAGLKRRCPPSKAGRLRASIHVTKVGANADFVGGFVLVSDPRVRAVEARRPFVAATAQGDGPRAVRAMVATIGGRF